MRTWSSLWKGVRFQVSLCFPTPLLLLEFSPLPFAPVQSTGAGVLTRRLWRSGKRRWDTFICARCRRLLRDCVKLTEFSPQNR